MKSLTRVNKVGFRHIIATPESLHRLGPEKGQLKGFSRGLITAVGVKKTDNSFSALGKLKPGFFVLVAPCVTKRLA